MRIIEKLIFTALLGALVQSVNAQGFINLDFENAVIIHDPSTTFGVYASNAIPGWTAYIDGTPQTDINYNAVSLGAAWVSIHGPNDTTPQFIGRPTVLQGQYSMMLQVSAPGTNIPALGQIGTIPASAKSIMFYAANLISVPNPIAVSFAGRPIPTFLLSSATYYNVYGGDISAFAGQTGQLLLASTVVPTGFGPSLDNITFSDQPIPEPSGLALFGVGALLLGFFRRRNSLR